MKTIYLKVQVPDDLKSFKVIIDAKDRNWIGTVKYEEIQLPTIIDIQQQFPTFDEIPIENVYRAEGAFYVIDKLKSL